MSYPVHYVPAGDVLPVFFSSYGKTNGESITLTGLAVTDVEIYKDGSVTQRASDAGYALLDTDGIDFDGITGIHGFSIDTGDNTDAGFYTVGAWFHVVVSAVTIDSQTVNFVACAFRLMPAEAIAAKPKVDVDGWLGTACATPTTNGVPEVDVTHVSGTAQTAGDICGKIGTPANLGGGATLAQNLSDIEAQTDDIGAAGAGLTALASQASVNTIDDFLDTEIAAILAAVDTETAAILALLDDARAEPGQGAPPVNPDLATKIDYLYKFLRNKVTQTSTLMSVYADDGATIDHKSTVSDDGTTYTRGEFVTGA
jgi:hypothetical protein